MRHDLAPADRIADIFLRIVAGVNLLFVLVFLAVLILVAGRAHAEDGACEGKNLLDELAAEDPALLRRLREEAADTPNGEGLLWRVEAAGGAPSHLFGTMHVSDPRVVSLPEAPRRAFDRAEAVVIETTDALDQKAMMAAMAARPDLMMFPPGESLADHLSPQERETVEEALSARGVPFQSIVKMKPWMLISLTALPACEMRRREAGAPMLDAMLANEAKAKGKQVAGLETMEEQLSAIASLPMELHVRGLVSSLDMGERADDMSETLIGLYKQGDTGMFWPAVNALASADSQDAVDYAAFEEAMIVARNEVMVERAKAFLDAGGAFVAVGAMHLPGETGLIALLREAGYTVTRAD